MDLFQVDDRLFATLEAHPSLTKSIRNALEKGIAIKFKNFRQK